MKTKTKVLIGVGIIAVIALVGFLIFLRSLSPGGVFGHIDPLRFSLSNKDGITHEVTVEIFDSSNRTIFNKMYTIEPRERVQSPEITKDKGEYMYKVTVDNTATEWQTAYVGGSNCGVMIDIYSSREVNIILLVV
ncbi:MAG: hypothetical protein PHD13_00560 [Methanocellales archaeon]|nr:hypothetical protein [Methanocellales archaeon]MDD3291452.1 hypothetical protein [Methanocellales archaeon]MDD5234658.1 hypothetical protein [Methanocellales archaeon]MDD5484989.1 hypothetical protein [Methanocellales archaeon]